MSSPRSSSTACVPNIGRAERRKRMTFGVVLFTITSLAAAALVLMGVDRLWRLPLLLPFWAGAIGVFQAREKT